MTNRKSMRFLAVLAALILVIAACADGDANGDTDTTAGEGTAPPEGDLGAVTIAEGEPIKIAAAQAISGGVASLGQDQVTAIEVAIEARGGELLGHPIELTVEDELCNAEGGTTAATNIVADPQIIGIIGTSCSGAGVPASQIMSEAGLVMISGSTTSPSLTALPYLSDEELEQQENNQPGFFRTAHNDEFQGAAAGQYAFDSGAATAVTIHDGDPYTEGLVTQFGAFYEAAGGELVLETAVNKGDTDMRPILTEVAAADPDIIFFPIFQPEADFIVQQIGEFDELSDTVLMGADGLLSDTFVTLAETEGMIFSGPAQAEGGEYEEFLASYEEIAGTPPIQAFHAHAYDAANMLLDAIEAVAQEDGGSLVVDRQALRDYLYDVEGFAGLTGTLSCNEFGDCAQPSIGIFENTDPAGGLLGVFANIIDTINLGDQVDPEKLS